MTKRSLNMALQARNAFSLLVLFATISSINTAPIRLSSNENIDGVLSNFLQALDARATSERRISIRNDRSGRVQLKCLDNHFDFGSKVLEKNQFYVFTFDRHSFDPMTHFWCEMRILDVSDTDAANQVDTDIAGKNNDKMVKFAAYGEEAPHHNNQLTIRDDGVFVRLQDGTDLLISALS